MHRLLKRAAMSALTLLLATGVTAQDRPVVAAVNYPLQYFAERLLGEYAEVVFPVPDDVDPSFWRPSIADISMIQSADLILLNGAAFATWVDRVSLPRSRVVNTSASIKDQFIVTESITHSHGDGGEHSHEGVASYLWLDPTLAAAQAEAVAEAIAMRDLAPSDTVEDRLADLRADLDTLDQQARTAASELKDVVLIATHPRYQYFARRYDLKILSLEWEAGAAPSAEQLTALRDLKAQSGAEILIWEAAPPDTAVAAVSEIGLKSVVFPTLVHKPAGATYVAAYSQALSALSELSGEINN